MCVYTHNLWAFNNTDHRGGYTNIFLVMRDLPVGTGQGPCRWRWVSCPCAPTSVLVVGMPRDHNDSSAALLSTLKNSLVFVLFWPPPHCNGKSMHAKTGQLGLQLSPRAYNQGHFKESPRGRMLAPSQMEVKYHWLSPGSSIPILAVTAKERKEWATLRAYQKGMSVYPWGTEKRVGQSSPGTLSTQRS